MLRSRSSKKPSNSAIVITLSHHHHQQHSCVPWWLPAQLRHTQPMNPDHRVSFANPYALFVASSSRLPGWSRRLFKDHSLSSVALRMTPKGHPENRLAPTQPKARNCYGYCRTSGFARSLSRRLMTTSELREVLSKLN